MPPPGAIRTPECGFGPMAASARFGSLVDMRILLALGGNALLRRGEAEADAQRNLATAAQALAAVASEHEVVITHGNRPPVGPLP
ncbi:MAG TPA: hypothetical protein VN756_10105, partial [Solirubrobacterales bacterium]|nr:hypothetical protein [Solirubrobacterales bacterium]